MMRAVGCFLVNTCSAAMQSVSTVSSAPSRYGLKALSAHTIASASFSVEW